MKKKEMVKKVVKHINKDDKEFRGQIKDDMEMKKILLKGKSKKKKKEKKEKNERD